MPDLPLIHDKIKVFIMELLKELTGLVAVPCKVMIVQNLFPSAMP